MAPTVLDDVLQQLGRSPAGRELATRLEARLAQIEREDVVRRIWSGQDHTVWSADPTEITQPNRLGWLRVAERMQSEVDELRGLGAEVRSDGIRTVVLLGMGGSGLAPEVMFRSLAGTDSSPDLVVLDTTVPAEIAALEAHLDLSEVLFVVASKSGTTIETASHLAYFWHKLPLGRQFIAITDPGTPLAGIATERDFRRLFLNPPEIGGRYSALSFFGLAPAALCGIDPAPILAGAIESMQASSPDVPVAENAAVVLGALLGEAALAGHDKLTLCLPDAFASLGDWIEQLLAESTGKLGRGIIPIIDEPLAAPDAYGSDRLLIGLGDAPGLSALQTSLPAVSLPFDGAPEALGAEFFSWQLATAVAGYVLGINPFDQPDVQSAKDAAARFLSEAMPGAVVTPGIASVLDSIEPNDYVAIQAYLPREPNLRARLQKARIALRDRYHVATTLGFGPRYLHSTGQVHKGGPASGVFLQLMGGDTPELPVPGRAYSFAVLERAQARGDLEALRSLGRRVVRCSLEELEQAAGL